MDDVFGEVVCRIGAGASVRSISGLAVAVAEVVRDACPSNTVDSMTCREVILARAVFASCAGLVVSGARSVGFAAGSDVTDCPRPVSAAFPFRIFFATAGAFFGDTGLSFAGVMERE
ncbi:MAG: hypothetical protein PHI18_08135 [bacterium]|nr:hypothetical protein [bacterium]